MNEGNGAKLDAATKQTSPTQANGHRIRTKEIFSPEARVLAHDYRARLDDGPIPKGEMITADLNRAANRGFELRSKNPAQPRVLNGEGDAFGANP
jgi:hypothetical protein